jgi:hypothetical protein
VTEVKWTVQMVQMGAWLKVAMEILLYNSRPRFGVYD